MVKDACLSDACLDAVSRLFTCMYADCENCVYHEETDCKGALRSFVAASVSQVVMFLPQANSEVTDLRDQLVQLKTIVAALEDRVRLLEQISLTRIQTMEGLAALSTPITSISTSSSVTSSAYDSCSGDQIRGEGNDEQKYRW